MWLSLPHDDVSRSNPFSTINWKHADNGRFMCSFAAFSYTYMNHIHIHANKKHSSYKNEIGTSWIEITLSQVKLKVKKIGKSRIILVAQPIYRTI